MNPKYIYEIELYNVDWETESTRYVIGNKPPHKIKSTEDIFPYDGNNEPLLRRVWKIGELIQDGLSPDTEWNGTGV